MIVGNGTLLLIVENAVSALSMRAQGPLKVAELSSFLMCPPCALIAISDKESITCSDIPTMPRETKMRQRTITALAYRIQRESIISLPVG